MFKNVAGQKAIVYAFDSTTNLPKTGDAANLTAYVSKDYGAVTVLGDTSATELDATNAKGYYLFDLAQAETNADEMLLTGKSSTANIVVLGMPAVIYTVPANWAVTLSAAGVQAIWDALTSALTTVGSIGKRIADFLTGDAYVRLGAPAGASVSADVAAVKTDTAAVKVQTDKLAFTVANQVDCNVLDWKSAAAPAMTGDAFARLGAPAGASVSADVAAVKSDTATVLTDVNTGAGAIYTRLGAPAGASLAADISAVNAKTTNLPASPAAVGSNMGSVTSVSGAVASVTGNVGGNVVGSVASVAAGVTVTTNNDKTGYALTNAGIDAVLDRANGVETGMTVRQALRLQLAALVGKLSGASTATILVRDVNDTKNRLTLTADASGNRTAVTTDVS